MENADEYDLWGSRV
ncbi:hypothetical protein OJ628_04400 [Salmonella enterica subsp. enterica]|nr:hypothetical protein OJ628_04400 [Salmonella enterica subsp. enterica]